jgi:phosphoribosylaminoimidazole (AIR) synthetase
MYRVFNMGVGFVLVCDRSATADLLVELGDQALTVGEVVSVAQVAGGRRVDIPRCR